MKRLALILMLAACSAVHAATITFTGVVDTIREGSPFHVGDTVTATFRYNPKKAGAIQSYTIIVGDVTLSGKKDGQVAVDNDPTHGSVYYQVINSSVTEMTMQAGTPDGVIPPVEQFNLNDYVLLSNTFGHFTALPVLSK